GAVSAQRLLPFGGSARVRRGREILSEPGRRAASDRGCVPRLSAGHPALHIVLVRPEIPQNTGSIARLAAATRTRLHLVGPLGFSLEDRYLKRAGLDYWPLVDLVTYQGWQQFMAGHAASTAQHFAGRAEPPP